MVALTTTVGELLKEVYGNTVFDLLNSRDQYYGMIAKDYAADGELFQAAHRVGRSGSMRYGSETATLPTAQAQKYSNSVITPKEFWATLSLSMRLIKQSRTNRGSFERGLKSEMKNLSKDIRNHKERVVMGDGSGALGVSAGAHSSNVITLVTAADARKFTEGQFVEWWSSRETGASQHLYATGVSQDAVEEINLDAGTITFDAFAAGATVTAGSVAVIGADPSDPASTGTRTSTVRYEPMGIDGMILDTDTPMESGTGFQGILAPFQYDGTTDNTGGVNVWSAPTLSNGGTLRSVTDTLLHQALDAIMIRGNGDADHYVCPFGVRLEYAIQQLNIRRNTNTIKLAGQTGGGFSEDPDSKEFVDYANLPVIPNRYARANTIFCVDSDSFHIKYWGKPGWWDDDGNVLRKDPGRAPQLQAEWYCYDELCCEERNSNARIEDVAGTDAA